VFVGEKERAKHDDDRFRAWLMIGRTDLAAGKAADAVTELRELLAWKGADQDRGEALLWLGESLVAAGDLDGAHTVFVEASRHAKKESFRSKVDIRVGDVLVQKGDHVEAARFFNELALREADPTARAKLELRVADAERKGGRLDAARATLEGIVEEVPKSEEAAEAQFQIGLIHAQDRRNYDDAMAAFDKVREISPGALATRSAGEERQKILELQRLQGGLAELDSTRTLERAEAEFAIGEVLLLKMNDAEGALTQYRASQAGDPAGQFAPRALLAAAWVLEQKLARPDEAVLVLKDLAAKYPDSPQAERARGLLGEKGEELPAPAPIPLRKNETETEPAPEPAPAPAPAGGG
jgi:TolA-binding protein